MDLDLIYDYFDEERRLTATPARSIELLTTRMQIAKVLKPGMRILDVGAGSGAYSLAYAQEGYAVTAVEPVKKHCALMKAKRRPAMDLTILEGNALDLTMLEAASFDGSRPYAVVQLRQDNAAASMYNVVGFQTHLKWPEQRRILRMIPGLENCEILRYGVMHRNSYINSPLCLRPTYQTVKREDLFFAGQMTGVEGYIESAASGLNAGLQCARLVLGLTPEPFPQTCMIGAMAHYITHADPKHFQPMNANFGILPLVQKVKKSERKEAYGIQALNELAQFQQSLSWNTK